MVSRAFPDGTVTGVWSEAPGPDDDPAFGRFLGFLARDMAQPQGILPVPVELAERAAALTEGVEVDLERPLPPDGA